jgi:transcriptional regulator PpsR
MWTPISVKYCLQRKLVYCCDGASLEFQNAHFHVLRVTSTVLLWRGSAVKNLTNATPAHSDPGGLSEWVPAVAQAFASLTTDIALVLDDHGVIRSVANGNSTLTSPAAQDWVGRAWADTVTGDTRGKIEQMLKEVNATGVARRREINHPSGRGDVAVAYTAMRLGPNGPLLAVGRDLSAVAAIQQRFLTTQHEMERSFWKLRQDEARYRLLFQVATDAVMVVDSASLEILEANQAAAQLLDMDVTMLVGRPASFGFERHSRAAVDALLAAARSSGQPSEIRARLLGRVSATSVAATPFRADDALRLMVRLRTMDLPGTSSDITKTLARLVDSASDGVLITDTNGCILMANPAFLKLVQKNTEADVKTRPLMDWVSVSDDQFAVLLHEVRHLGIARRMSCKLMSSDARCIAIEITAALLTEGDQECIGFTLHAPAGSRQEFPHSKDDLRLAIDELTARIGIEPLPDLLRSAAALLQRHFITHAMARCADSPKAAADLLGIRPDQLDLYRYDAFHSPPESF